MSSTNANLLMPHDQSSDIDTNSLGSFTPAARKQCDTTSRVHMSNGSFPSGTVGLRPQRDMQKENVHEGIGSNDMSMEASDESANFDGKAPSRFNDFRTPLLNSPNPNNDLTSSEHVNESDQTMTKTPTSGRPDSVTAVSLFNDDQSRNDNESINESSCEETLEQRQLREQEESEALARQLMAEEAVASYAMSTDFLRDNAANYSEEDLAALEAAMAEEDPYADDGEGVEGNESVDLSYETMLRIGERLGDVKQERWEMVSREIINKIPIVIYNSSITDGDEGNDSLVRCLVCQCAYEEGESLRKLPCGHCFHADCVDHWLSSKDVCPYCRQTIQE